MKHETGRNITIAVLDIKRYCLSLDVYKMFVSASRTRVPIVKFIQTLLLKKWPGDMFRGWRLSLPVDGRRCTYVGVTSAEIAEASVSRDIYGCPV